MQHSSAQVFKRNQLLVLGSACYLLSWVLLELLHQLTPVQASFAAHQQHQQRNPFTGDQAWAQQQQQQQQHQHHHHHRHLLSRLTREQQQQANDDEANQRAIASLGQLLGAADRAPQLWNVDFLSANAAATNEHMPDGQESPVAAHFNAANMNFALPASLSSGAAVAAAGQRQQQQQQQHEQHFPQTGSTAPSVNRQLMAPPSFYELALAPTSALQFDTPSSTITEESSSGHLGMQLAAAAAMSQHHLRSTSDAQRTINSDSFSRPSLTPRSLSGGQSSVASQEAAGSEEQPVDAPKQAAADGTEAKNSSDDTAAPAGDDKVIEPRQRRRIFNRILKKAEWNHLFVELSKVFLKYFLDLALKDIIGKQSGSETTTSRKKLDAQSELTDLLKDFFKTAISNI